VPRRVEQTADTIAWVESPFQLLGALEAFASGRLGSRLAVLPRHGVAPLAATVDAVRALGLPPGAVILPPGRAPRRWGGVLAVGDAFSGEVHRTLVTSHPHTLVLLDDGRSTRRVMDALVFPDVPLVRPHITPTLPRALLARTVQGRLRRMAHQNRLDVVTALRLPPAVVTAAELIGVRMYYHAFEWLRARPGPGLPTTDTVVLGTSLVANDLIAAEPYLEWVAAIAADSPVTYRAHRREDSRTLGPLRANPRVTVETGQVPVEVSLRGMTDRNRVLTLPTTAVSSMRLITPEARIQEFAVPDEWWLPGVPRVARLHLVPDSTTDDAQRPADPLEASPGVP
jgi:hypothetical protein